MKSQLESEQARTLIHSVYPQAILTSCEPFAGPHDNLISRFAFGILIQNLISGDISYGFCQDHIFHRYMLLYLHVSENPDAAARSDSIYKRVS